MANERDFDKINYQTSIVNPTTFYSLLKEVAANQPLSYDRGKNEIFPKIRAVIGDWDERKPDTHSEITFVMYGLVTKTDEGIVVSDLGQMFLKAFEESTPALKLEVFTKMLMSWHLTDKERDIHPGIILLKLITDKRLDRYLRDEDFAFFTENKNYRKDKDYETIVEGILDFRKKKAAIKLSKSEVFLRAFSGSWKMDEKDTESGFFKRDTNSERSESGENTLNEKYIKYVEEAIMEVDGPGGMIGDFRNDIDLKYQSSLIKRFISLLCTKPFVILTGLSGSGKTKLAQTFAKWITLPVKAYDNENLLKIAIASQEIKEKYDITGIDSLTIEVVNKKGGAGTKIPLPKQAVFEWFEKIIKGDIKPDVAAGEVQGYKDLFNGDSRDQKYIQGFYLNFYDFSVAMYNAYKTSKTASEDANHKCTEEQYKIISVGADWTNNEHLLGYPNALKDKGYEKPENGFLNLVLHAIKHMDLPHFLILDEMNLSHVERYFADFLSAMESGKEIHLHDGGENWNDVPPSFVIPDNLFIIGTVNIDETTYMFSPKVLDRAGVVEFSVSKNEMEEFLKKPLRHATESVEGKGFKYSEYFMKLSRKKYEQFEGIESIKNEILKFFNELKEVDSEFGYRTAMDICRFAVIMKNLDEKSTDNEILDAAIMQKLLPKIYGSKSKLQLVLEKLGVFCLDGVMIPKDKNVFDEMKKGDGVAGIKYTMSFSKINKMYEKAKKDGFASFIE